MIRRPTTVLMTGMLVVVAMVGSVQVAGAQSSETRELQAARDRIAVVARELESAEQTAEDAEAALADADERLAELEAIVNDVAATLERQRGAVGHATDRLAAVRQEAAEVRASFEDRAAAMFKQGPVRSFELLFSSRGAEQALDRSSYLRALTRGDAVSIESLTAAETAVEVERERLAAEQRRLDVMLAEQRELLEQVEDLRASRALAAADARARVEELSAEHAQLETASEELEELVRARKMAYPSTGVRRGASSSGYAWPYCGPVTSEYGRRWGRMHNGIDIGGGTGTPIGSSKAGTVIFAGWNDGGYGNLVLIRHGDGVVTAYAHQSRIATSAGAVVSRGERIGYVGSTGNVTGPHLHQEFRVNGAPVNPRQYLKGSPC